MASSGFILGRAAVGKHPTAKAWSLVFLPSVIEAASGEIWFISRLTSDLSRLSGELHYAPVNVWPGYTSDGANITIPISELAGLSVDEAGTVTGDWREIFQSTLLSLLAYMDWEKDNPISAFSRPQTLDISMLEDWNRPTVNQMRRDIQVKFNIQYAMQKITEEPT